MKYLDDRNYLIKTGIGLQDVDHLKNSSYFVEISKQYVDGEITLEELENLITSYYDKKPDIDKRTEEADKVSQRIAKYLSKNDKFELSTKKLLEIHKYLFDGIFEHAGHTRECNIQKSEWVLDGDTVTYGDYRNLIENLEYDFSIEKVVDYSKLDSKQTINHLARFIANLWQNHVFLEGNTRTISVFFIKYLDSLGYDINNDSFEKNAWYFRNALVRANYSNYAKAVYEDTTFLVKFLKNLLLGENNKLLNRDLHISKKVNDINNDLNPTQRILLNLIRNNEKITTEDLSKYTNVSVRTVKNAINAFKEKGILKRINGKRFGYWEVIK